MQFVRRIFYLLYYLKESDFRQLKTFVRYSSSNTGLSEMRIILDSVISVFRYNISIKDYFCFRFFELNETKRCNWAGTGFMYEYQLKMNPKPAREVLEDKLKFLKHFQSFVKREYAFLTEMQRDRSIAERVLSNYSERLVLKGSHGQVGEEVEIISCRDFTSETLVNFMKLKKYDLLEEYVVQHPALMTLSPSGLNTVRIFTQLHDSRVEFLGARLRVSVNSPVDNMAAGNIAAPIDIDSGVVNGPGVYSDITKPEVSVHPVTGIPIEGFSIPHWELVKEISRKAALHNTENRSIGWDIAITQEGPELIEGNHNWCKLLWQMPIKQGLKSELEKYL
jgi:hypothetical protein